jgi:uncharacterized membrane protein
MLMIFIALGILLFAGPHLFSALAPAVRNRLMAWAGEARYKGAYAASSLLGVVLMAVGYLRTWGSGEYYFVPIDSARHITMLLVLIGFILMSAMGGKSNIRLWAQNPFSLGIMCWATGHIIANGEKPLVWIFAAFLVVALVDVVRNMVAGNRPNFKPEWRADMLALGAGIVIYALALLLFHPYVLGVPVLR